MELIAKIRAEIERRKKAIHSTLFNDEYNDLHSFLDSLESEKPVPNDLEEAADNHIRKVADIAGHPGWDWTTQDIADAFIAGYNLCKEQMMKEAVKWLVDDDYDELTEKGRFILGSVGISYNGYYIPYSDLLKLPKEERK